MRENYSSSVIIENFEGHCCLLIAAHGNNKIETESDIFHGSRSNCIVQYLMKVLVIYFYKNNSFK